MSYIEDDFRRELDAWDPARLRRIKPRKKLLRRDALVEALSLHPPAARAATLALFELYASGELPQNDFCDFCLGYSLVEDLGESIAMDLESDLVSQALGATSVGLADDGCGMRYFVDREGTVLLLDLSEMPYRWQHLPNHPELTFASVDVWCWAFLRHSSSTTAYCLRSPSSNAPKRRDATPFFGAHASKKSGRTRAECRLAAAKGGMPVPFFVRSFWSTTRNAKPRTYVERS